MGETRTDRCSPFQIISVFYTSEMRMLDEDADAIQRNWKLKVRHYRCIILHYEFMGSQYPLMGPHHYPFMVLAIY